MPKSYSKILLKEGFEGTVFLKNGLTQLSNGMHDVV
jgi:hypothetical protein